MATTVQSADELQRQIDEQRATIRTDRYSMSIGELANLYENEELEIHPEFQRFYRWDEWQKTRLIESVMLGIPIPQLFVAEREDGVWELVDGLQRVSTFFQFMGVLRTEDQEQDAPLILDPTDRLPDLDGRSWDARGLDAQGLSTQQKIEFKRARIDVSIIRSESSPEARYELFQRLNTGGSRLSDQEVRNCLLVWINSGRFEWLSELTQYEPFQESLSLTDRARSERYDMELALRFLALRRLDDRQLAEIRDVGDWLDDTTKEFVANETAMDETREKTAFEGTFNWIYDALQENAFRKFDVVRDGFRGGFLVSAFEAIAGGIGFHYEEWEERGRPGDVAQRVRALWELPGFGDDSRQGVRGGDRLRKVVPLSRRHFAPPAQ
ncbi:MAG: DUF262 domain-containing protein [Armatimonadia bacterium]|nr:DUF262 domain-containing protein [Armatimonadia bacterium]